MTEEYKKWANLDIKDIEPMEVTEIEIARMKKKVVNNQKKALKLKKMNWRNIIAASLFLLGVIITASTTSIATNIKGYFEDVTNWNGTVVDTQYTAGIDDIKLEAGNISELENQLVIPLTLTLKNIQEEPFASMESLGLREVTLVNTLNNEIIKLEIQEEIGLRNTVSFELRGEEKLWTETTATNDSSRVFKVNFLVNDKSIIREQDYKLKIQSLYIYKTADAPLEVKGDWQINLAFK